MDISAVELARHSLRVDGYHVAASVDASLRTLASDHRRTLCVGVASFLQALLGMICETQLRCLYSIVISPV
jgi:hypothetical protein